MIYRIYYKFLVFPCSKQHHYNIYYNIIHLLKNQDGEILPLNISPRKGGPYMYYKGCISNSSVKQKLIEKDVGTLLISRIKM